MDYLGREGAPISAELWDAIDGAVVSTAKETLVGRRFLPLHGPLGPGVGIAAVDQPGKQEVFENGFAVAASRTVLQIPQLYQDFWILWRDLEEAARVGVPLDVSGARQAAQAISRREDEMVFYGVKSLGIDGLLTAKGSLSVKRSNWEEGEGAFADVVAAVTLLQQKGRYGKYTLVVSPDLYVQLQRIQPGTGILESERVKKLVDGKLYMSTVLQAKTALLVCAQPQFMDLAVGQDISTAYTEQVDLNHHLRILETAVPRIKAPDAIVVIK
ncbi:MAG: family 1 encapsulin nanocompartment shell protein [Oscillospiraceae bacterium]